MTLFQVIEGFESEELDALMEMLQIMWEVPVPGLVRPEIVIIVVSETIAESDFPGRMAFGIPVRVIRPGNDLRYVL